MTRLLVSLALALAIAMINKATAQQPFDGRWSIEAIPRKGACNRTHRYAVVIENGIIRSRGRGEGQCRGGTGDQWEHSGQHPTRQDAGERHRQAVGSFGLRRLDYQRKNELLGAMDCRETQLKVRQRTNSEVALDGQTAFPDVLGARRLEQARRFARCGRDRNRNVSARIDWLCCINLRRA
jgi:hypothetical protein